MDSLLRDLERQAAFNGPGTPEYTRWIHKIRQTVTWDNRELRLITSRSEMYIKQGFPANHFAAIKDGVYQDLGEELEVIFFRWHPKAIDWSGETIQEEYDPRSKAFYNIVERANNARPLVAMYGPEWLVFCPKIKECLNLFFGSRTVKRNLSKAGDSLLVEKTRILRSVTYATPQGFSWSSIQICKQ